jgi:GNAT superfamily N-acetyltransferase
MASSVTVRQICREDHAEWLPLWDGYNAFYGRVGTAALPAEITACTWERFFNPIEPVFALVAESHGAVVGLAHYTFHRYTIKIEPVCYLQDLFTKPEVRRQGVGRALIHGVYEQTRLAGARRTYWHTQTTNEAGRALYDKVAKHLGFIVYSHEAG